MSDVVIIEAVLSAVGRRGGALSTLHPADLLAKIQRALIERSGIEPTEVGQVIGGCVSQVGEQSTNIIRTAWLTAGLPFEVAATTIDSQGGSSQQAISLVAALVGAGAVGAAVGCGVESMSRIPIGSAMREELGLGFPIPASYSERIEFTSQFEGAERIAKKWAITRAMPTSSGSPRNRKPVAPGMRVVLPARLSRCRLPCATKTVRPPKQTHVVEIDEGLRETKLENLAKLRPVGRPDGVRTAGNASQISDGATAILVASAEKAAALGLRPRARIADFCLVGSYPVLMLTGPIPATELLLNSVLITKALNELERTYGRYGLITMCCGGGLGTGMLIERI